MLTVTGSSFVLFSSVCVANFGQKMNLKIFHVGIFEGFGRYQNHFWTE